VLQERDLTELAVSSAGELREELGLAPGAAARLAAAFELGRRVRAPRTRRVSLASARRVFDLLQPQLSGLEQETFLALLLDGKHRLRRAVSVSVGTLTTSLVHPREVFRPAIRGAAAALIVAHNHPSGDPEPSLEDVEVTRRLVEVGELVGIPLLDHVVLGDRSYVSLRDRMPFGRAEPRAQRT
jgi:DNA repair protein RadC